MISGCAIALALYANTAVLSVTHAAPYSIEKLPDTTVYNDFVVGPGKYQVEAKLGETKTVNLTVTNRLGKDKTFQIQTEDFKGSRDIEKTVVLMDGERGPYSLKDYLRIASTTFTIGNAERVTIPVTIQVPSDAQPGGLYGSVVVSTITTPAEQTSGQSTGVSPVVTRIGSLVFIRVAGDVTEDLVLKDFSLRNGAHVVGSSPVEFQLLYENNGSVHENPSGFIHIKNMLGSEVADIEVEPWFVLPDSLRLREVSWNNPFLFGRYVATAEIQKGYDNKTDSASVVFWVIPWKVIALIFVVIIVIVALIRFIASKIHISLKK
jgi:hypothetical protein